MGNLDKDSDIEYSFKKEGNGLYVFVINGTITIDGQQLNARDGLGIWDTKNIALHADTDTEVLLMEIPMEF
jgi:redox-sensitive bicupin YhaK (pirin superfamily)